MIKIIKTEKEYQAALARVDALMDAVPGSPQADELELLALLVETYEEEHFPIDAPDPVEAIRFRMEQQGLTPRDLIPFLGNQSKVSEVLNHKRPLSLNMIRSLHEGLGIPLEVLIQKPRQAGGWAISRTLGYRVSEPLYPLLLEKLPQDRLSQWQAKTLEQASIEQLPPFAWSCLNKKLIKELVALSAYSAGPKMAGELLNRCGIHIIVQRPFRAVDVDGACFLTQENRPVISLTLRSDRLDIFWFTLFHLLAYLRLHQGRHPVVYVDTARCLVNQALPAEEKLVHAWLRDILAPSGVDQVRIHSSMKAGDTAALQQAIRATGSSPEVISCWLRLEKGEPAGELFPYQPRKISEKLEVYG